MVPTGRVAFETGRDPSRLWEVSVMWRVGRLDGVTGEELARTKVQRSEGTRAVLGTVKHPSGEKRDQRIKIGIRFHRVMALREGGRLGRH